MCAESYGFSILYLEAGSGAQTPSTRFNSRTAASDKLVLCVGGGIEMGPS